MNTPTSGSDRPAPPAAQRVQALGRRPERASERSQGEAFDRLLQEKTAGLEAMAASCDPVRPEPAPAALPIAPAMANWGLPPRAAQALAAPEGGDRPAAVAGAAGASPTVAAAHLAWAQPATPPGSPHEAELAAAWDVSLGGSFGAPLDLHATRVALPGLQAATNGWALSLTPQGPDAALLAQHLPRLNDRLRARTAGASHARIQERGEEPV